jgi:hypothetical protein
MGSQGRQRTSVRVLHREENRYPLAGTVPQGEAIRL